MQKLLVPLWLRIRHGEKDEVSDLVQNAVDYPLEEVVGNDSESKDERDRIILLKLPRVLRDYMHKCQQMHVLLDRPQMKNELRQRFDLVVAAELGRFEAGVVELIQKSFLEDPDAHYVLGPTLLDDRLVLTQQKTEQDLYFPRLAQTIFRAEKELYGFLKKKKMEGTRPFLGCEFVTTAETNGLGAKDADAEGGSYFADFRRAAERVDAEVDRLRQQEGLKARGAEKKLPEIVEKLREAHAQARRLCQPAPTANDQRDRSVARTREASSQARSAVIVVKKKTASEVEESSASTRECLSGGAASSSARPPVSGGRGAVSSSSALPPVTDRKNFGFAPPSRDRLLRDRVVENSDGILDEIEDSAGSSERGILDESPSRSRGAAQSVAKPQHKKAASAGHMQQRWIRRGAASTARSSPKGSASVAGRAKNDEDHAPAPPSLQQLPPFAPAVSMDVAPGSAEHHEVERIPMSPEERAQPMEDHIVHHEDEEVEQELPAAPKRLPREKIQQSRELQHEEERPRAAPKRLPRPPNELIARNLTRWRSPKVRRNHSPPAFETEDHNVLRDVVVLNVFGIDVSKDFKKSFPHALEEDDLTQVALQAGDPNALARARLVRSVRERDTNLIDLVKVEPRIMIKLKKFPLNEWQSRLDEQLQRWQTSLETGRTSLWWTVSRQKDRERFVRETKMLWDKRSYELVHEDSSSEESDWGEEQRKASASSDEQAASSSEEEVRPRRGRTSRGKANKMISAKKKAVSSKKSVAEAGPARRGRGGGGGAAASSRATPKMESPKMALKKEVMMTKGRAKKSALRQKSSGATQFSSSSEDENRKTSKAAPSAKKPSKQSEQRSSKKAPAPKKAAAPKKQADAKKRARSPSPPDEDFSSAKKRQRLSSSEKRRRRNEQKRARYAAKKKAAANHSPDSPDEEEDAAGAPTGALARARAKRDAALRMPTVDDDNKRKASSDEEEDAAGAPTGALARARAKRDAALRKPTVDDDNKRKASSDEEEDAAGAPTGALARARAKRDAALRKPTVDNKRKASSSSVALPAPGPRQKVVEDERKPNGKPSKDEESESPVVEDERKPSKSRSQQKAGPTKSEAKNTAKELRARKEAELNFKASQRENFLADALPEDVSRSRPPPPLPAPAVVVPRQAPAPRSSPKQGQQLSLKERLHLKRQGAAPAHPPSGPTAPAAARPPPAGPAGGGRAAAGASSSGHNGGGLFGAGPGIQTMGQQSLGQQVGGAIVSTGGAPSGTSTKKMGVFSLFAALGLHGGPPPASGADGRGGTNAAMQKTSEAHYVCPDKHVMFNCGNGTSQWLWDRVTYKTWGGGDFAIMSS